MTDPLWDPTVRDPDVDRLAAALAPLRHRGAPPAVPPRRPRRWPIAAAGVAVAAAAVLALWWRARDPAAPGCPTAPTAGAFRFEAIAGAPACGGATARAGWLPEGAWLETGAGDRARVTVADIGAVEVAEGSRLSLVASSPTEHRLALARGALHAKVTAPPRLFVVETPAATAIDLGCEYDLEVGADGAGFLRVQSGQVELADGDRVVVVPMGAEARILPGGPGTPIRSDAPPALRAAVARLDAGDPRALDEVLTLAGARDTVTLFNLLGSADAATRARIHDLLDALVGTPEDVLREEIVDGDPDALGRVRSQLEAYWLVPELLPPGDTWDP